LVCPGDDDHISHDVRHVKELTADHIVPRSKGGSHDLSNLRVLCAEYNAKRHTKPVQNHMTQASIALETPKSPPQEPKVAKEPQWFA
jgi:5-methylcytosine-specific restriction endonuclease McrA